MDSDKEERNPYRRLRREMFLVLLTFGLVPLVASAIAWYVVADAALETRTRSVLDAIVKSRKSTVELFLGDTMRQLQTIADAYPSGRLADRDVLETILEKARAERGPFVDLGLIAEDGRQVAYVGPYQLTGIDYSHEVWFQQVMVLGRYESDVFLGFRRFPHMIMAVKKREEGRAWIVRATVDTDVLSSLVREGGEESGTELFLLNREGDYQTHAFEPHRLMERADCPPIPQHSGTRIAERRRAGRRELFATTWLQGSSWVLVARQPMPVPPFPVTGRSTLAGIVVVGLAVIPLLAHLISRRRLRQFRELESERSALFESVAESRKMAAVGRLAAGVAHEINNPLAIIHAQAGVLSDLLADSPALPQREELQARIAKIEAQVERGRKVTHQLLGFSRRLGPELGPVDVAAALDETVGFLEKQLEGSGIRIVRDYAPEVPLIRSSVSKMQQVFLNLINNALDAVGDEGEVRLSVERAGAGVRVRVADDGPGIPSTQIARIFEPFYSTKSGAGEHTGLGLAICREIMKALGGTIEVACGVERGTVFTLWFPLEAEGA